MGVVNSKILKKLLIGFKLKDEIQYHVYEYKSGKHIKHFENFKKVITQKNDQVFFITHDGKPGRVGLDLKPIFFESDEF